MQTSLHDVADSTIFHPDGRVALMIGAGLYLLSDASAIATTTGLMIDFGWTAQ